MLPADKQVKVRSARNSKNKGVKTIFKEVVIGATNVT